MEDQVPEEGREIYPRNKNKKLWKKKRKLAL